MLYSTSARKNFAEKTVTSHYTSLRTASTASELRDWLVRELTTEIEDVLESPHFGYGVLFIDDLHVIDETTQTIERLRTDCLEALLKGLLDSTPTFSIKRNNAVRSVVTLGSTPKANRVKNNVSKNSVDHYFVIDSPAATLHKDFGTDPRSLLPFNDNFIMRRAGIISSATADPAHFMTSTKYQQIASRCTLIGMPMATATELHISIITSTNVCMTTNAANDCISLLHTEVEELSRITLFVCSKMIDWSTTTVAVTPIEQAMSALVLLDYSMISKFCLSLHLAKSSVFNPGALLQLYAHEWRRSFLDPLPDGLHRKKLIRLLIEQLDQIDVKSWSVSADWIKEIQAELSNDIDRVLVDVNILTQDINIDKIDPMFESNSPIDSKLQDKSRISPSTKKDSRALSSLNGYGPLELDRQGTERFYESGIWSNDKESYSSEISMDDITEGKVDRTIDCQNVIGLGDIRAVFYPEGIAFLLRLVRLLSRNCNILFTGFAGIHGSTALLLAAKICKLQVKKYSVKEAVGIVDNTPSTNAIQSRDFHTFLKDVVLSASGVKCDRNSVNANNKDISSEKSYNFSRIKEESCLLIVDSAQQLPTDHRKLLLTLLECDDPCALFSYQEVIGR